MCRENTLIYFFCRKIELFPPKGCYLLFSKIFFLEFQVFHCYFQFSLFCQWILHYGDPVASRRPIPENTVICCFFVEKLNYYPQSGAIYYFPYFFSENKSFPLVFSVFPGFSMNPVLWSPSGIHSTEFIEKTWNTKDSNGKPWFPEKKNNWKQ